MPEAVGRSGRLGELLRRLLPREPVSLDLVARADNLRLRGELEQAAVLCARVLAAYPQYASAHAVMGEILHDQGAREAAEACWQEACRIHPNHPRANLHLARVFLSRGDATAAMGALSHALWANPDSAEARRLYDRVQTGSASRASKTASPVKGEDLLAALRACSSMAKVALATPGLARSSSARPTAEQLAGTLMEGAGPVLERLGVGRLHAAFLQGEEVALEVFEVDGQYVLATLTPGLRAARVREETEEIIAGLRRTWADSERPHVGPLAA